MYNLTFMDEMDHYGVEHQCWQCAHYGTTTGHAGHCTSLAMAQCCRDMTGVDFTEDIKLPVTSKTDAGLCAEFLLSQNEQVREELRDLLADARLMAQRHAAHYNHLRRTAHA